MTKTKKAHHLRSRELLVTDLQIALRDTEYVGKLDGGGPIIAFFEPACRVQWVAKMTIDCDGSGGNPDNDPYYQDDTSLHYRGKALNAYQVPFVVVPPLVLGCVEPVVLGCMAVVINLENGLSVQAVVGDVGPSSKIGEASCECAQRVGLDPNPNWGGTLDQIIFYAVFPGIPAVVDGRHYNLQPS